jgi:hypothetical protein
MKRDASGAFALTSDGAKVPDVEALERMRPELIKRLDAVGYPLIVSLHVFFCQVYVI